MIIDKIYGLVIGQIIADILSNVSNINNQLGALPEIKQPSDADTLQIKVGQWTEPSALLLSYINNIMSIPSEKLDAMRRVSTLHTGTCDGVFCGELKDYHSSLYTPILTCYYYTDFERTLQVLKEEHADCTTKLWTAIVDLALHDVPKKSILNPLSYANLNLPEELYSIFDVGEEGTLYQIGEASTLLEQMKAVLHIFAYCRNFVDGMMHVVNYMNNPVLPACLYGQLAGAFYGFTDIPPEWISTIQKRKYINNTISKLTRSPAISHVVKIEKKLQSEIENEVQDQLN